MNRTIIVNGIKAVLRDTLQLGERADRLEASSPLFGAVPEFDSMAVITVLTMLEEEFGIAIEDEDISVEIFATVGTLADFVARKVDAWRPR